MSSFASLLKKLLFPPLAVAVPLVLFSASLLIYVFLAGLTGVAVCYAAYTLSFYSLIMVCASVPSAMRACRGWIRRHAHMERFVSDYAFRTHILLFVGLFFNLAFAGLKFAAGCLYASDWLISLGFYYAVLALMRFFLLRRLGKAGAQPCSLLAQYQTYRLTGILMFLLNIGMTGIIVLVIHDNRTYSYPGTLIYAFAAYAFYKIIMAILILIRRRKHTEPLLAASRSMGLAVAIMSVFSLQTALLSTFGDSSSPLFRQAINAASGSVVCIASLLIALRMIVRGSRAIQALRLHHS